MKFRDPTTGDVFKAIGTARAYACRDHTCDDCPLGQFNQGELYGDTCAKFVKEYPAEAARLMGLEVVEDTVTGVTQGVKSLFCEQIGVLPGQPFIVHSYPYRNYPPMVYGEDGCVRLYSPDGQKRHKVGGRAITWIVDHPESVEPCRGYTPQEVAFKKEEKLMEKQDKPRICEVLGVEVGERFKVKDFSPDYYIDEAGRMLFDYENAGAPALLRAINHPEDILRKPRFTQEEVAVLRTLYAAGARWLARGDKRLRWYTKKPYQRAEDGKWAMQGDWGAMSGKLPAALFPALRPGQAVELEEIVG